MDFGGRPPPMDDTYFPTLLSEEEWKKVEDSDVSFDEDQLKWYPKLMDELKHMEKGLRDLDPHLSKWFEETDYAVRFLRCLQQQTLADFYITEMEKQRAYQEKVHQRKDRLISVITEHFKGVKNSKPSSISNSNPETTEESSDKMEGRESKDANYVNTGKENIILEKLTEGESAKESVVEESRVPKKSESVTSDSKESIVDEADYASASEDLKVAEEPTPENEQPDDSETKVSEVDPSSESSPEESKI